MPPLPEPINHLVDTIYRVYETRNEYERTYLGMSTLGNECDRALWYGFRWTVPPEKFDGRKLRLFETGNREEDRLLANLHAAGLMITKHDPATGKQWEVRDATGHIQGHLDAIATGLPDAPKTEHVVECKTFNDRSFKALVKEGVEKSKPGHYAQMMLYMHHTGITRALYVAVNKNDDSLYTERVKYDAAAALRFLARAERIVAANSAPAKLHEDPKAKGAFSCTWCPALAVCHEGAAARRNCRTCLSSEFRDGAEVWCTLHNKSLTYADQQNGCGQHLYLPSLVSGEQIDADDAARTVTYRMSGGGEWVDGGAR